MVSKIVYLFLVHIPHFDKLLVSGAVILPPPFYNRMDDECDNAGATVMPKFTYPRHLIVLDHTPACDK